MRVAKRINPKTGNEQPLRTPREIVGDIHDKLFRRIRYGAPMVTNEEIILIFEALELILEQDDDEPDYSEVGPSDPETSGKVRGD